MIASSIAAFGLISIALIASALTIFLGPFTSFKERMEELLCVFFLFILPAAIVAFALITDMAQ